MRSKIFNRYPGHLYRTIGSIAAGKLPYPRCADYPICSKHWLVPHYLFVFSLALWGEIAKVPVQIFLLHFEQFLGVNTWVWHIQTIAMHRPCAPLFEFEVAGI